MRPSTSSRYSTAQGSSSQAIASRKLLEKRKEYEAVTALAEISELFTKRLEALGDDCDDIGAAGEVMGRVLEQWPSMFRILGLVLEVREHAGTSQSAQTAGQPTGDVLVRVPVEDLQLPSEGDYDRKGT